MFRIALMMHSSLAPHRLRSEKKYPPSPSVLCAQGGDRRDEDQMRFSMVRQHPRVRREKPVGRPNIGSPERLLVRNTDMLDRSGGMTLVLIFPGFV